MPWLHVYGVCACMCVCVYTVYVTVITTGPPSDTHGEAFGFSLVYSGNFLFEAEINDMNRLRVNMGIHPMCMQWHLQQGTSRNNCAKSRRS